MSNNNSIPDYLDPQFWADAGITLHTVGSIEELADLIVSEINAEGATGNAEIHLHEIPASDSDKP